MPDHTPRRIACLQPSATVILAEIGELDRVVACTKYCADVVPEITSQDAYDPCRLLDCQCRTDYRHPSRPCHRLRALSGKGGRSKYSSPERRFIGLAPKTLADIYTDIAIIAGAVGASDRGEEVIARMQQTNRRGSRPHAGLPRPQSLLRRMGQAADRVAALGRGTGRSRRR